MIRAPKKTRLINAFVHTSIPSARDLFRRYGQRLGKGIYTSSPQEGSSMTIPTGVTVIDQMIDAQYLAEKQMPLDTDTK